MNMPYLTAFPSRTFIFVSFLSMISPSSDGLAACSVESPRGDSKTAQIAHRVEDPPGRVFNDSGYVEYSSDTDGILEVSQSKPKDVDGDRAGSPAPLTSTPAGAALDQYRTIEAEELALIAAASQCN